MRPLIAVILAVAGLSSAGIARDTTEYRRVPVNVSLIPPIAVAGWGRDATINVGYNIIAGRTARLEGIELGFVANIQRESARGFQGAVFVNRVGGPLRGGQAAAFVNSVSGPIRGGQFAGLINHSGGAVAGGQAAGLVSYAGGDVTGLQASGILNVARGATDGAQASGILSVARAAGFQASGLVSYARDSAIVQAAGFVNYADATTAQLGFINVARRSRGAQLGFINWADEQDGVPIGAFSHVGGVPVRPNVWADETGFANIGILSGTPKYYSLFYGGVHGEDDAPRWWSFGTGFGAHIVRGGHFYEIDLLNASLMQGSDTDSVGTLNRLRFAVGWQIAPRIAAYAGASLNLFVSTENDGGDFIPYTVLDGWNEGTYAAFWPGIYAGLRF